MDLITKQIDDKYVRQNFEKIEALVNDAVFLQGNFKFFEFRVTGAQEEFKLYHKLGFNPNDIFVTKAIGSSFEWIYTGFNSDYLTIKTTGDLYLRVIIGNLRGSEVTGSNAFADVTDDLGPGGGTGGGIAFFKKDIVVGTPFLSARDITLQGAPVTNSERVYVNGLIIDDTNYTLASNILTVDNALDIEVGDDIYVRFAS
jgi:hypothetical protein